MLALPNDRVRKGATAKLRHKMTSHASPKAWVLIKIKRGSTLVKKIAAAEQTTGVAHTKSLRCTLKLGTCEYHAYAWDELDHPASRVGSKTLMVK